MSVYTKITKDALTDHLRNYSIGKVKGFEGISDGIENTNYLLLTEKGEYIFTIFENLDKERVDEYLNFMNYLNNADFRCAHVELTNSNELSIAVLNKPSAIIEKLEGKSILDADVNHCHQIGQLLSEFHNKGSSFSISLKDSRDLQWKINTNSKLSEAITKSQKKLIEKAIELNKSFEKIELPVGKIHADLFKDNVLFNNNRISGMIDFYYSCDGSFLYDIGVVVNDWCINKDGSVNQNKLVEFTNGYQKNRKLSNQEKDSFAKALCSAALRFYLSRLHDLHFPKIGEMTHIKDPSIFENILSDRISALDDYKIL
tara:strand:- start:6285 stop:7229 length:945 start_codon:yes stop_codon:yes gene_type:complete